LRAIAVQSRVDLWIASPADELFSLHPRVQSMRIVPRGFKAGNLQVRRRLWTRCRLAWRLASRRYVNVWYPAHSPEPLGHWLFTGCRAVRRIAPAGDLENQFDWQRDRVRPHITRLVRCEPGHDLNRNRQLIVKALNMPARAIRQRPTDESPTAGSGVVPTNDTTLACSAARPSPFDDDWRPRFDHLRADVDLAASMTKPPRNADRVVAFMPGSSLKIKAYPIDAWTDVLRVLADQFDVHPLLLGGADDRDRIAAITASLDRPVSTLTQPMSLPETGLLLRQTAGLVAVDTGLAHLAVALNVPTVVLVSGGHPGRFFPWPMAAACTVLSEPVPCAGCANHCIHPTAICLDRIPPDRVVRAVVDQILSGRRRIPVVR
jgi:ADP-heptose:LPS heptosyltransferase